jgi:hypothetical protein
MDFYCEKIDIEPGEIQPTRYSKLLGSSRAAGFFRYTDIASIAWRRQ